MVDWQLIEPRRTRAGTIVKQSASSAVGGLGLSFWSSPTVMGSASGGGRFGLRGVLASASRSVRSAVLAGIPPTALVRHRLTLEPHNRNLQSLLWICRRATSSGCLIVT
jgi:hypothetical protein